MADEEEFEVCKTGGPAAYTYSRTNKTVTPNTTTNHTTSLTDGECQVIAYADHQGERISITEVVPAGYSLDSVRVTVRTGSPYPGNTFTTFLVPGPTYLDSIAGSGSGGVLRGVLVHYFNSLIVVPPSAFGRMTGGGAQITAGNVRVSRGFTLHCDILLSNNLEINWPGSGNGPNSQNNFHITRPLRSAQCILDPAYQQPPPAAPFNTFIGVADGTLNGVPGAYVRFTFIDAGEPGRNDKASFQVFDHNGVKVLDVPLSNLNHGNIQAHYDQPHGHRDPHN